MKLTIGFAICLLFYTFSFSVSAGEKANIIVALDGSGQFTSIQEAINAVPSDNKQNIIILIRNGVYHEKIYIQKNHITLVGENRDSTRIVYAELRKNWEKEHNDSDWGSAVINIDSSGLQISHWLISLSTITMAVSMGITVTNLQFVEAAQELSFSIVILLQMVEIHSACGIKKTACIIMLIVILKDGWILFARAGGVILPTASFMVIT